jgi:TolA-binding protein
VITQARAQTSFATINLLIVTLMAVVVSACGTAPKNEEPTLGSLEQRDLVINPQPMPTVKQTDAKTSYEELARTTSNPELKAKAMERLADIQLEQFQTQQSVVAEKKVEAEKHREAGNQGNTAGNIDPEKQAEIEANQKQQAAMEKEAVARQRVPSREQATRTSAPALASQSLQQDAGSSAMADYENVAKQYEGLLKRHPHKKDNDRILYQLARAYDLSGNPEKTLEVLTRFVKQYPENKQIEEVQFRRGEILFSFREYARATEAYADIMVNKDSPYYQRALYKLGWSQFKQGKLEPAQESFYQLLDIYFKEGRRSDGLSRSEQELVKDTLRVVSLSFSFQDGPESIKKFSNSYGARDYEYRIYQQLAGLYMKQERFADAAKTYSTFVERYPNSRQAPLFMVKVIDIYKTGGYAKALSQAKADFVTHYGANKFYWSRQDKTLFNEIAPSLKKNLEDLARHYHALGQKTKKAGNYKVAIHWYREYVDSFPGEAKTAEMNFLLAELLNEIKNYKEAAVEYEKTAYEYKPHAKSAEAGYAAILAHQHHAAQLKGKVQRDVRIITVKSSLHFADTFSSDARVPQVVMKSAEELLDMKMYGDASIVAQRITTATDKRYDKHRPAAWAIIASAEFEMGHHKLAEQATLQRLQTMAPDDKNRKVFVERLAAAIYKQGEAARDKGHLKEAAAHFLRIGKLAPTASILATAEYDAAAALTQLQDWTSAIPVLQNFIKHYPDNKFTPGAVQKLAVAYEKSNDWGAAAQTYEKIYQSETDADKKRALLWQTAEYYEKAKREADAIKIYKVFVSHYPQPLEQAVEARQRMADIYKTQEQTKKRRYWLSEIVKANDGKGATERTGYLAAMASMELAAPKYKTYMHIKLVQPLKANLKKKKTLLKEVINAYTKAANYGVEAITTASTYRIAEAYNNFSKGLFKSERPKGLSGEELEQYNILLEEQAYPFEEKAIKIHETNASRVTEGVYDEWVRKSFAALKKLRPVRYAKSEKRELFTKAIN